MRWPTTAHPRTSPWRAYVPHSARTEPDTTLTGAFDTAELPRLGPEPVTLTVERVVVPGREADFETWANEVLATLAAVPGFLGGGLLRSGPEGRAYQLVFRFTDAVSLRRWERSPERLAHLARLDEMVVDTRVQRTVGVDTWFDAPAHVKPRRSRMHTVFVEVAWVYPCAAVVTVFVAPHLGSVPLLPRIALTTTVITSVMLLVVTPIRAWRRGRRSL